MHLFPTRFFSLSPLRFEILCSPLLYVSAIWMLLSCCCAEALFSCCCFFPLVSLHCKLRKGRKYIHMHLQSSVDMQAFKKLSFAPHGHLYLYMYYICIGIGPPQSGVASIFSCFPIRTWPCIRGLNNVWTVLMGWSKTFT